jgi:signal transduction histidine kinase
MRWRRNKNGASGQYRSARSRPGRFTDTLLTPPDMIGSTETRVLRTAQRLRFLVAAMCAVVFSFPVPGLRGSQRVVIVALVVGYTAAATLIERAFPASFFATRLLTAWVGFLAIFTLGWFVPSLQTALLFTMTLGYVYYTLLGGLGVGMLNAGIGSCTALVNNMIAPSPKPVPTLVMVGFLTVVPSIVMIVDLLTRERRRAATGLDRLHEALRAMSASPNLGATLASVIEVIDDAVGSKATGILLRQGDHLVLAAPEVEGEWALSWAPEQAAAYTRRELELRESSPIGVAAALGEVVVVPEVNHDSRFPHWIDEWRELFQAQDIVSLIAVPLQLGPDIIGVLSVCFEWAGALDTDDLELLESYAGEVAIFIARAQAYEQEHEAARRLAEADRMKSEFLAMVSHELRTPLTAAKGFVDTVLLHWDRLDDERRRALLERASSNADELSRLVSQLLDFSRLDADRIEVRPQRCNLRDLVDALATDMGQVLGNHEVHINVADLAVSVDPSAFGQVLQNLLTNAAKFSPPGAAIQVDARALGDEAVVCVKDGGVGIPVDEQDKIFDRFYQAKNSDASRRGTGIGLSIVRRFVEMHGGRVWVASTPGSGSEFFFTLPLAGGESDSGELPEIRDERAAS